MTDTSEPQAEKTAKRSRRGWRIPLLLFLLLALLLFGLLTTVRGLFLGLDLVETLAPGVVRVDRVQGSLFGDLVLRGLTVRLSDLQIEVGELHLRWSPWSAFGGTLRIQALEARDLEIVQTSSESPSPASDKPLRLPEFRLPIGIDLQQFSLHGLRFQGPDDTSFRLDEARISAALGSDGRLAIRTLDLHLPEPALRASLKGRAWLQGEYPLDLSLEWRLTRAPDLQVQGHLKAEGDMGRLRITQALEGSVQARLDAQIEDLLHAFQWRANLDLHRIDLPGIQADLPPLDLSGHLEAQGDLARASLRGSLAGTAPRRPEFGHLNLDLALGWQEKTLTLSDLRLTETGSGARMTATGRVDLDTKDFDLHAAWKDLRWPLIGGSQVEVGRGSLATSGTLQAYTYSLETQLRGPAFPSMGLKLLGRGGPASTELARLDLKTLKGSLSGRGTIRWEPVLAWDLNLRGRDLDPSVRWPQAALTLGFQLQTAGTREAFTYHLTGEMKSTDFPQAAFALRGQGDGQQTRIQELRVDTLGGVLQTQGQVAWAPRVSWDLALRLADLDPGVQWPQWKGTLGGAMQSVGQLEDAGPRAQLRLQDLKGRLRGYPIQATGAVRIQGHALQVQSLRLVSGPSHLAASGQLGDQLALQVDLRSPDLSTLMPEAKGKIALQAEITGTREAPAVDLNLRVQNVALAQRKLRQLRGRIQADLAAGGGIHLDLQGRDLRAGTLAFERLALRGQGPLTNHQLALTLEGKPLSLRLKTHGALVENAYTGRVQDLRLRSQAFGTWHTPESVPFSFENQRIRLGPFCLEEAAGSRGCITFAQTGPADWNANLRLKRLAFGLIADRLPAHLKLQGNLKAEADVRAKAGHLRGQARIQIPRGTLAVALGEGKVLDFSGTHLDLDGDPQGLRARFNLPLATLGGIQAEMALPGWRLSDPARPRQSLRGRFRAQIPDLGGLAPLAPPDLDELGGRIQADLTLGGTLAQPNFRGFARLEGGHLGVPLIGFKLADLRFEARARSAQRIEYRGGFKAGEGHLNLEGETRIQGPRWDTQIQVQGTRLTLADTSEYFLLASPEVRVSATPEGARIQGTIRIPEARIQPQSVPPGTVSPSPDVVLAQQAQTSPAYPVTLDLRLVLGEEIRLDAFGLRARLGGDLRILQTPGKPLIGDGQLEVIDGTYRLSTGTALTASIGKPLRITQGLIVFAKTPLENPGLVLTAKREGGDMTAGVRVFGTLRDPKLTFFSDSDPGMTQSEITNYLVTGIPPRNTEGAGDQGLSLGTYVAPKLFMEYENSLGDTQDKVRLRYEYNNWIEFQTETGESQGADVFFKFER